VYENIGRSLGIDYFRIADQLSREELDYLRRTRDFVDNEVLPVINGYWERAEFPWPAYPRIEGRSMNRATEPCRSASGSRRASPP
jgi:hypothetical protein